MIDEIGDVSFNIRANTVEFIRQGSFWVLFTISLVRFLSIGIRQIIPAILPGLKLEFGLSNAAAGLTITLLWIAYAFSQLPGGIIADVIGERKILIMSIFSATIGLTIAVNSPGYLPFIAGLVLFGFGIGLLGTARITVISDVFQERGSTAIGINNAIGGIGAAGLPVLAGVLSAYFGWRVGLGFALPLLIASAVAVRLSIPIRTSDSMEAGTTPLEVVRYVSSLLGKRDVAVAWISMGLMGFIYQGFTGLLPTYLESIKAFDHSTAVSIYGLFFVGAVVVQPFAGVIADTYGKRPTLIAVTILTSASLLALPFARTLFLVASIALLASVQMAFWPVILEYVASILPEYVQGSGMGLIRTTFLLFSAAGPSVVGGFADVDRFDEAYLLLSGLGVSTFVLCMFLLDLGD